MNEEVQATNEILEKRAKAREKARKAKQEKFEAKTTKGARSIAGALNTASRKARKKDLEIAKAKQPLTDEELEKATEFQTKAKQAGMILIPERKIRNNVKFAQMIQPNMNYLREIKYLTVSEKAFIIDFIGHVGFLSNCLVENTNARNAVPITQTDLARILQMDKSNMSKKINSLIDKGILARSESGLDDNNVRAYALFVNPNVIFSGSKDDVNATLQAMFKKVPKELKNLPIQLF